MTDALPATPKLPPLPAKVPHGIGKYVAEIFQDVDGGYSMKRFLVFVFALTFLGVTGYVVWYGVAVHQGQKTVYSIPQETLDFLKTVTSYCIDAVKWLSTLVLGERVPQAAAAIRGNQTPAVTSNE